MHELTLFSNKEGFKVRVVIVDGEPWFVAKDVCDILGLGNARQALSGLDNDEKTTLKRSEFSGLTVTNNDGQTFRGGAQLINIISESGLYALIIRSNKPEAKAFRRWITHEVLPAIRKTGRYVVPRKTWTKAEIEKAGREFFMDCYREGGMEMYLEKRYPDKINDPRSRVRPSALLTRQEKRWLEEAEGASFLAGEGHL
jgi:prophage antirepressor-like protein